MDKKSCKFCLKIIGDDFQTIEEILIGYMDELLLKLSPSISKETVMCSECASILQAFFNFKNTVCYMEDNAPLNDLKEDFKLNLEDAENSSNVNMMLESNDQTSCYFCMKFIEREGLISLYESKEDVFMLDKLKEHISELISNNTELLTCGACVDSVRRVLGFILNCLDVKMEITGYNTEEGVNDKDQIQFKLEPLQNEDDCFNINEIGEDCYKDQREFSMGSDTEMKFEQIDNLDMTPKTENVWIKSELSDSDSFRDAPTSSQLTMENINVYNPGERQTDQALSEKTVKNSVYKCQSCPFVTKHKASLKTHLLIHQELPGVRKYTCDHCSYVTKHNGSLKTHMLTHQDPSEVTVYKCQNCSYVTIHKGTLKSHMLLIHRDLSEVTVYKCHSCSFESKYKNSLRAHVLIHRKFSEVAVYKCGICSYAATQKWSLKSHMLVHQELSDVSEVTEYKCQSCLFVTKRKASLRKHMLVHQDLSDESKVTVYKCQNCPFITKHNQSLKGHMLVHRKLSEVRAYSCESCSFVSKHQKSLRRHMSRKHPK